MPFYLQQKILPQNPFMEIDREGVGALVNMAIEKARRVRPDIELGVCGEHGGDPHSIEFFHQVGLDYVSCSPYRLPVARLARCSGGDKKQKNVARHGDVSTVLYRFYQVGELDDSYR